MFRLMSPLLLGLALALGTASAHSQSLNPRWLGTWKSAEDTLTVTDKGFKVDQEQCKWSNTRPTPGKTCQAYYEASVSKEQLVKLLDDAEAAIKRQSADTGLKLKPADKQRMRERMTRSRQALAQVSSGKFKTVALMTADGRGDCDNVYFVDKESLYLVIDCKQAPETAALRAYARQP